MKVNVILLPGTSADIEIFDGAVLSDVITKFILQTKTVSDSQGNKIEPYNKIFPDESIVISNPIRPVCGVKSWRDAADLGDMRGIKL